MRRGVDTEQQSDRAAGDSIGAGHDGTAWEMKGPGSSHDGRHGCPIVHRSQCAAKRSGQLVGLCEAMTGRPIRRPVSPHELLPELLST